jgi:phosphate transport system substrate-binding protein
MRGMARQLTLKILGCMLILAGCGQASKEHPPRIADRGKPAQIRIQGANALYLLAQSWSDKYTESHPGVIFSIFPSSSSKGKADVLSGMSDIGMFSGFPESGQDSEIVYIPVARDAIVPTFNPGNPFRNQLLGRGIDSATLRNIFFTGEIAYWGQLFSSNPAGLMGKLIRSDASGASAVWADYLGGDPGELLGNGVYGDAGMTMGVRNDPLSIGYDNLRYIFDSQTGEKFPGIDIIPIDLDGNYHLDTAENFYSDLGSLNRAIVNKTYPAKLSRTLYFIIKKDAAGPVLIDFLQWVISTGKDIMIKNGYIGLLPEDIVIQDSIMSVLIKYMK